MRHEHAGRLRVVWDTNVYISALQFQTGPSLKVWLVARERRFQLVISPAIIEELARVLRNDFEWPEQPLQDRLRMLTKLAKVVVPREKLTVVADDPSDDRILECAVEGHAQVIVSGDKHLKKLKVFQGIPNVTVLDFLRMLGDQ